MAPHEPGYRFCPVCAAALQQRLLRQGEPERLTCPSCGFIHYVDPKVAAGAIVRLEDERVLLLRRAIEPGYGKWVFPGGYVDLGEVVEEAARHEAREEACVEVAIDGLLNVYSYPERPVVVIVYMGRITSGSPAAGDECSEAALFHPHEIPWDDLAFPSTTDALRDFLRKLSP